jgi:hypothetical protein
MRDVPTLAGHCANGIVLGQRCKSHLKRGQTSTSQIGFEILCESVYLPCSGEWLILATRGAVADLYSQTATGLQSVVQVVPSCETRLHLPTSLLKNCLYLLYQVGIEQ